MTSVRCLADARDQLGEGPLWDASAGRLYWFDIKGRRLHWIEPATEETGVRNLDVQASAAAVRSQGGLLVASDAGLGVLDPDTGHFELRESLADGLPGYRTNDGKIDLQGRFWWSIMDDAGGVRPGRVYRTGPDWRTVTAVESVHIANTVCCSPDGRTFYLADSAEQTLYAYEMEPRTGDLGPRQMFAHTQGEAATPDGSAVDAEGFLWNAQWGGWRVVRYAPDGAVDRTIELPVEQPTSCAFGGPDLSTLYVTSARDGLSEAALAGQPLAGGLFAIGTGVRGLPLPAFAG